jgi:hypothetical protein
VPNPAAQSTPWRWQRNWRIILEVGVVARSLPFIRVPSIWAFWAKFEWFRPPKTHFERRRSEFEPREWWAWSLRGVRRDRESTGALDWCRMLLWGNNTHSALIHPIVSQSQPRLILSFNRRRVCVCPARGPFSPLSDESRLDMNVRRRVFASLLASRTGANSVVGVTVCFRCAFMPRHHRDD